MRTPLYLAVAKAGRHLGFAQVERLGRALGRLIWRVAPSRRRLAVAAMERHLDLTARQAEKLAFESFQHNGRSFACRR